LRRAAPCRSAATRPLWCVALRCVALRCVALRCVALRCVALRCVALRCVALRFDCFALLCFVLLGMGVGGLIARLDVWLLVCSIAVECDMLNGRVDRNAVQ
jgi:hypothetical protein